MYGQNPTAADQREAMQALRDTGVATVSIEFSGGNDEGGPDGIKYLDAEGNVVPDAVENSHAYQTSDWDAETKSYGPEKWVVHANTDGVWGYRDATADEVKWAEIAAVLEAPIYDRWGSFAGEFHVYGTLRWDVAAGTHTLSGQESHEVYEDL